MLNQEAVECLSDSVDSQNDEKILSASLYSLYHILHSLQAVGKEDSIAKDLYPKLTQNCVQIISTRAPLELFWVLFVLSCDARLHHMLVADDVIGFSLDTCTYEIFQASFLLLCSLVIQLGPFQIWEKTQLFKVSAFAAPLKTRKQLLKS